MAKTVKETKAKGKAVKATTKVAEPPRPVYETIERQDGGFIIADGEKPPEKFKLWIDGNSHTCIEVDRPGLRVKFVQMDLEAVSVKDLREDSFSMRFKPLTTYSVTRAILRYLDFASRHGATDEALALLAPVTTAGAKLTAEAREAMTKKKGPKMDDETKAKLRAKGKKGGEKKPRGVSAASTFRELIMRGTLTDDQIFEKAKEMHGLDDKKRSYVSWYRNQLKKEGAKPPEPKGGAKKADKKPAKKADKKKPAKKAPKKKPAKSDEPTPAPAPDASPNAA